MSKKQLKIGILPENLRKSSILCIKLEIFAIFNISNDKLR